MAMDAKSFEKVFNKIVDNINTVIHGQDDVVRMSLTAICAGGHITIEQLPGVGHAVRGRALWWKRGLVVSSGGPGCLRIV